MTEAMPLFTAWENFYVIVGSSGAALTGLQFVVMALISDSERKGSAATVNAFGTPTIVHFCVVLTVAAILSAPWQLVGPPSVLIAFIGVFGIGYASVVTLRSRRQKEYKPVLEDWVWHSILPLLSYVSLFTGAIMVAMHHDGGLFAVAATCLLLLLIGIHNAWDSSAYITTLQHQKAQSPAPAITGTGEPALAKPITRSEAPVSG